MSQTLPAHIARLQWNNRLKSFGLILYCLVAILAFAAVTIAMIIIPISFIPGSGLPPVTDILDNHRVVFSFSKISLKILNFCLLGTALFLYRSVKNIEHVFSALQLNLPSSDPFYRALENFCITRGLAVPKLYVFSTGLVPASVITSAVILGFSGSAGLIITRGCLTLPDAERDALLAQAVQRLYTKDSHFLSLFCFLGYFPFHLGQCMRKFLQAIFKLPLLTAEALMTPLRKHMLNLRMARLDIGALEISKDAEAMRSLLGKLATFEQLDSYFYSPYLTLFIAQSADSYRDGKLAADKTA